MTIELTVSEKALLHEILEHELREISSEVRRTQTTGYREELKEREKSLQVLEKKLAVTA